MREAAGELVDARGRKYLTADERARFLAAVGRQSQRRRGERRVTAQPPTAMPIAPTGAEPIGRRPGLPLVATPERTWSSARLQRHRVTVRALLAGGDEPALLTPALDRAGALLEARNAGVSDATPTDAPPGSHGAPPPSSPDRPGARSARQRHR